MPPRCARLGKARAAKKALLAGWKEAPHPLIAAAYLAPLATPLERAQAASELAAARPGHAESELILGETALEARLTGEARRHAEVAMATHVDDGRAADILASLEGRPAHAGQRCRLGLRRLPDACADWAPVCPQLSAPRHADNGVPNSPARFCLRRGA